MKIVALKSFSGTISMFKGEIRDVNNQKILDDLLRAGYIEPAAPRRGGKNAVKQDKN